MPKMFRENGEFQKLILKKIPKRNGRPVPLHEILSSSDSADKNRTLSISTLSRVQRGAIPDVPSLLKMQSIFGLQSAKMMTALRMDLGL
jgi:hypothetical protein